MNSCGDEGRLAVEMWFQINHYPVARGASPLAR